MNFKSTVILGILTSLCGCSAVQSITPTSDLGDLQLSYQATDDPDLQSIKTILQKTAFFDDLTAELNDTYKLPQDIQVNFAECQEDSAFYDPETVEIRICYEFLERYANIALEEYQEDYRREIILAGYFTFLHELGHALVDLYQLPIVVREEDAVDSFATYLLLETGEEDAVIAGMEQFDIDATEEEEFDELPFWGEHSLSIQRVYNIACLIYGSDPHTYADFVEDDFLPLERAEVCPEEYDRVADGWQTLLRDFVKQ